ncbi:uncharacterized protein LOC126925705 isoform X4 [Bombus affinis]|uniref:uncharacterized protein LOC126925705 isoform X4 n=1 Tax=Bombus affinis TaxID=309941 RepID=UPI0021B81926|nr:uncharacterized protein LOC126925705 isoform X4 [Bombus affinis]
MANPLGTCALNSKLNTKYETNKLYCCRRCCLLVHKLLQTFINFYKKSSNHVRQCCLLVHKLLQTFINFYKKSSNHVRQCCLLVHKLLQTFINFYKKSSNHVLFIDIQNSTDYRKHH